MIRFRTALQLTIKWVKFKNREKVDGMKVATTYLGTFWNNGMTVLIIFLQKKQTDQNFFPSNFRIFNGSNVFTNVLKNETRN